MCKVKIFRLSLLSFTVALAAQQSIAADDQLVVSASKQSQYAASSQNVAAYKISGNELTDANITGSKQLAKVLPGVTIGKSDSFVYPQTAIRGISSLDFYNSALTLYIDGVPQPSVAFSQALYDVKSVEMLKGPQATLYGKAAQGGIVDIVTELPAADYTGYLSAGYASRGGYQGKFTVSGPIAQGLLYGSVSGLRQVDNGRLTNPGTGHGKLNGEENNAGSLRLRLAPDDQPWEVNGAYNAQCSDSSQGLYVPLSEINSSTAIAGVDMPDPKIHRCIRNQLLRGQYSSDKWLFSAISSWQQVKFNYAFPNPGGSGPAVNIIPEHWSLTMQEIRAATQGAGNDIDAVIGLYRETITHNRNNRFSWGGGIDSVIKKQSLAAYTDLTWHISSQWDAGAGLRISRDKADVHFTKLASDSITDNTSNNHVLGQLSAGYQVTKNNRIYARIAQGYQAGGFDHGAMNIFGAYQPEKTISYELGHKYQTTSLNLQGAVFYSKRNDIQMYRGVIPFQTLQNAGDSTALGLELNGDYIIVPGLKLGAAINLTRSKFSNDEKNNSPAGNLASKKLPFVPDYGGELYLTGNLNTGIGTLSPYLGVNVTGGYEFKDSAAKQSAWTTTDIRLAWQATDHITLSAYVDNVFDKRFASYAFDMPGMVFASVNNGRTAGIDLKIDLF